MKLYMWNKIKTIIVTVLATLGVLFIIIMIIPIDEDDAPEHEIQEAQVEQESGDDSEADETEESQEVTEPQVSQEVTEAVEAQEVSEAQETQQLQEDTEEVSAEHQNVGHVVVDIPASEISDKKLKFTTRTLDGKKVNQDIFSDYDITLVHVWGTYCGPCLAEIGKYARFYETVPENVNIVGIVCDVYDGIDNNVDYANEIISEAGVGFMNLRTSDSVYDVTDVIQAVPTAFFVDREGHIIGEMMQARGFDATISRLNGYLR